MKKKTYKSSGHTSFYDGRFVAGTDREYFEHSGCGPKELFVGDGSHDTDQFSRTAGGQDDQFALLGTKKMMLFSN